MSMHNLIEYSSNYSEIKGTLCFYSKDEANDFNGYISSENNFKSFKYKTRLIGNTVTDGANEILKKCNICFCIKIFK